MLILLNEKNKKKKQMSLSDFNSKNNKILIIRNARGMGDIFMCRMLFEDIKKLNKDCHITFACPPEYHVLMKGHPFLDELIDSKNVNKLDYGVSYDISTCCWHWECANAPYASKHRSDIWAEHCGYELTTHDMHLPFISPEIMQYGFFKFKQMKNSSKKLFDSKAPNVLFTPYTFEKLRTLQDNHIRGIIKYLRKKEVFIYSTHNHKSSLLEELDIPVLCGYNTEYWMGFIHAADYVVTADTSVFHYAGGIKKPMTGIFTHADGKYRGKYFDFVLVQKHRDNKNWPCGPCYNYGACTHPDFKDHGINDAPRPCLTHLTVEEITCGLEEMFQKWQWKS